MLRDNIIRSIASSSPQWQGAWADGTSYVVNDLVEYNGSVYIATANHIASSTNEPEVGSGWTNVWDLFVSAGADGAPGADGVDGAPGIYTECDKLIMEMEMEFKTSYLCYYKELAYNVQKQLITVDIYTDSTANVKLFHKDLTYNVQKQLSQTDLTRISDGALLTSIFTYDAQKQLISVERHGYCSCAESSSSSSSSISSSSSSSLSSSSSSSSSLSSSSTSTSSSSRSSSSASVVHEIIRHTFDGEDRITLDGELRIIL
jgi:hypothetical protein